MWDTFKQMSQSKKFQAAVLAGVVWGAGKLGLQLSTEELLPIVGPLWGYIFGQGLADFGKEAKKG